ncbi:MAG: four helix bundle protein [Gemmatimonadaceae bacterium]
MQDFRKVKAWQANRLLIVRIYRVTASFPREERFGITAQMRESAISIGANIAEGCGRGSSADTHRFFHMSFGSAVELLHHLITSLDLGYLSQDQFDSLEAELESVRRMTAGFMKKLKQA